MDSALCRNGGRGGANATTFDLDSLEDDFDEEPEVDISSGSFCEFELVGHGRVTSDYCGKSVTFKGCLRVELHDRTLPDGNNYKGKVYVRRVRFSCGKPSCPICFKSGWAVREGKNVEHRLKESSKHFGDVEHIVASVPVKDYGLDLEAMRHKVIEILTNLGVVGGCLIFHPFRYNLRKWWYLSPHFHVLGHILGGYSRCRHCKGGDCYACNGFEGRCYKCYHDNGYIVRVLGERETVYGTAWYQLNHAGVKANSKRFHVATWFGVCSYRKLKVEREYREEFCPICKHDLIKIRYNGSGFVVDWDLRSGLHEFFADAVDEYGRAKYIADGEPSYG